MDFMSNIATSRSMEEKKEKSIWNDLPFIVAYIDPGLDAISQSVTFVIILIQTFFSNSFSLPLNTTETKKVLFRRKDYNNGNEADEKLYRSVIQEGSSKDSWKRRKERGAGKNMEKEENIKEKRQRIRVNLELWMPKNRQSFEVTDAFSGKLIKEPWMDKCNRPFNANPSLILIAAWFTFRYVVPFCNSIFSPLRATKIPPTPRACSAPHMTWTSREKRCYEVMNVNGSLEKNDKCPEDKRIRDYRNLSLRWDHDLSWNLITNATRIELLRVWHSRSRIVSLNLDGFDRENVLYSEC